MESQGASDSGHARAAVRKFAVAGPTHHWREEGFPPAKAKDSDDGGGVKRERDLDQVPENAQHAGRTTDEEEWPSDAGGDNASVYTSDPSLSLVSPSPYSTVSLPPGRSSASSNASASVTTHSSTAGGDDEEDLKSAITPPSARRRYSTPFATPSHFARAPVESPPPDTAPVPVPPVTSAPVALDTENQLVAIYDVALTDTAAAAPAPAPMLPPASRLLSTPAASGHRTVVSDQSHLAPAAAAIAAPAPRSRRATTKRRSGPGVHSSAATFSPTGPVPLSAASTPPRTVLSSSAGLHGDMENLYVRDDGSGDRLDVYAARQRSSPSGSAAASESPPRISAFPFPATNSVHVVGGGMVRVSPVRQSHGFATASMLATTFVALSDTPAYNQSASAAAAGPPAALSAPVSAPSHQLHHQSQRVVSPVVVDTDWALTPCEFLSSSHEFSTNKSVATAAGPTGSASRVRRQRSRSRRDRRANGNSLGSSSGRGGNGSGRGRGRGSVRSPSSSGSLAGRVPLSDVSSLAYSSATGVDVGNGSSCSAPSVPGAVAVSTAAVPPVLDASVPIPVKRSGSGHRRRLSSTGSSSRLLSPVETTYLQQSRMHYANDVVDHAGPPSSSTGSLATTDLHSSLAWRTSSSPGALHLPTVSPDQRQHALAAAMSAAEAAAAAMSVQSPGASFYHGSSSFGTPGSSGTALAEQLANSSLGNWDDSSWTDPSPRGSAPRPFSPLATTEVLPLPLAGDSSRGGSDGDRTTVARAQGGPPSHQPRARATRQRKQLTSSRKLFGSPPATSADRSMSEPAPSISIRGRHSSLSRQLPGTEGSTTEDDEATSTSCDSGFQSSDRSVVAASAPGGSESPGFPGAFFRTQSVPNFGLPGWSASSPSLHLSMAASMSPGGRGPPAHAVAASAASAAAVVRGKQRDGPSDTGKRLSATPALMRTSPDREPVVEPSADVGQGPSPSLTISSSSLPVISQTNSSSSLTAPSTPGSNKRRLPHDADCVFTEFANLTDQPNGTLAVDSGSVPKFYPRQGLAKPPPSLQYGSWPSSSSSSSSVYESLVPSSTNRAPPRLNDTPTAAAAAAALEQSDLRRQQQQLQQQQEEQHQQQQQQQQQQSNIVGRQLEQLRGTNPGLADEREDNVTTQLPGPATTPWTFGEDGTLHRLPYSRARASDQAAVSSHTLARLLTGRGLDPFTVVGQQQPLPPVLVVDCRFPYEFQGGHIRGAVNLSTRQDIESFFFRSVVATSLFAEGAVPIIVFHCEFSSHRGPALLRHLRELDRNAHKTEYPRLMYPELYLLEGGYSKLYEDYALPWVRNRGAGPGEASAPDDRKGGVAPSTSDSSTTRTGIAGAPNDAGDEFALAALCDVVGGAGESRLEQDVGSTVAALPAAPGAGPGTDGVSVETGSPSSSATTDPLAALTMGDLQLIFHPYQPPTYQRMHDDRFLREKISGLRALRPAMRRSYSTGDLSVGAGAGAMLPGRRRRR